MQNRRTVDIGFTLVELMVVILILSILAASLIQAGMVWYRRVMVQATTATLAKLTLATANYASDHNGTCPPSHRLPDGTAAMADDGMCGIQVLCAYLFNPDAPYLSSKDISEDYIVRRTDGSVDFIVDAWGTPLFYYRPGAPSRNADQFDLWSAGPDAQSSTRVYGPDGTELNDYTAQRPWEWVWEAGHVVSRPAPGPTGQPGDMPGHLYADAAAGGFDQTVDDIGDGRRRPVAAPGASRTGLAAMRIP